MKRPLAMFERAMYVDARFHVNVMVTAHICGQIQEQRMTEALAQVQAKHTTLRCRIVQENGHPYFLLEDRPMPIPLRIITRQSDDDWFEVSTQESLQRFDGSRQPLARMIWLRAEQKSELLLVCSHALCDGRSLVTLMREILLLCDQPEADIGSPTSLNGIEE
ncbi:MAG TPA: condensation domain-containing protein, partial [Silvibacterium sp.]|nr:condensation domain-containing protein [Silvibacterium sp.]